MLEIRNNLKKMTWEYFIIVQKKNSVDFIGPNYTLYDIEFKEEINV